MLRQITFSLSPFKINYGISFKLILIFSIQTELNKQLNQWQTDNAKLTKQFCDDLLLQLKRKHMDPVLQQLRGSDGSKLSFDDIIGAYQLIKEDYDARAVGAKDAIAAAFFDFHPVRYCSFITNLTSRIYPFRINCSPFSDCLQCSRAIYGTISIFERHEINKKGANSSILY